MTRIVIVVLALAAPQLAAQRLARGRPGAGNGVELEGQVAAAQATQGAVHQQDMTGFGPSWSGGAQLLWQAPGEGARLRIPFTSNATGRYEAILSFTRAPDYGRFDVRVDGGPVVTLEGYAPSVRRDSVLLGVVELAAGPHELLLVVSGKAPQSSGFLVGLDRVALQTAPPLAGGVISGQSGQAPPSRAGGLVGQQIGGPRRTALPAARAGTIANVPAIRLVGQGLQSPPPHAGRAPAPRTAAEKSAIATGALGSLIGNQPSSLMSQNGLQVDEAATIRLTAAQPVIEGRANLSFGDAISYSSWPLVRFSMYPAGSTLSQQLKPFFNVDFKVDAAEQPYLVDCAVDVGGEIIFETASQSVTLSGVTRHYTLFVMTAKPGWQTVSVVLHSGKLTPGGTWMGVDLHSCEITPLK